ncbi:hypothetical protein FIBSPDRAFT_1045979 [Athelia psychrophila]|uniref:Uncharacterized protein n=1 Tax=Athelia psychrophila TaxID=1759441 RepID=A0A166HB66_9AGAM|nr:hypothetical protein FIBSPDRAFT_1045979 [Fibularhizoctonia sp. CBS 109695]
MLPRSNTALLGQSRKVALAKKKEKREQIKEIVFDDDARRDFLTGFHKRKLDKATNAKNKAIERDKQERLATRREQRSALAERAAANAAEVEKAYGGAVDNSDEDLSLPSSSRRQQKKAQGHTGPAEEEFEDEEQLATVTVVEDFDPDTIIHGPTRVDADPDAKPKQRFAPLSKGKSKALSIANAEQRKAAAKANMAVKAKKSKPKNTPYETKADRGIEKRKQRARRTEKAERAGGKGGGKATRKPYGGASGSGTRAKAPPGKKR